MSARARWLVALAFIVLAEAAMGAAAVADKKRFDVPSDDAERALRRFSAQAGVELIYSTEIAKGVRTNAVHGEFAPLEAAKRMLRGTGLSVVGDAKHGVLRIAKTRGDPNDPRAAQETGSSDRPAPSENSTTTSPMNTSQSTVRRALASAAALFAGSASDASEAKPKDEALVLSPFTVSTESDKGYMAKNTISGTGTNETLMKIPQTIQIANQELIRDLGADDPMQAIEMTSGSVARRSFNVGDDSFVWGFRVMSALKDSIPFATNSVGTLYDVDRIEVIKGPAAMMFGQNSYTGGVINYVTRKPSKTSKHSARASFGSFNYRSAAINLSGPVSEKFRYRADLGATESNYSERKFGFYKDRFVGAGAEYDLSPRTKLAADLSYGELNTFRPRTMFDPATRALIAKPDDYTINQPWTRNPVTQVRGTATLTTALTDAINSRSYFGYNDATNDWFRDVVSATNPTARTLTKNASHFDTSRHFFSFGQDFVGTFKTGPLAHKVILGGDQRNEKQWNVTTTYALTNPIFNFDDPVYDATATSTVMGTPTKTAISSRSSGAFLQDQISLWKDRVILLAGMRYNEFFQRSGSITGFSGPATISVGDKVISRYGVIVQPFPQDITLYYNRSESFLFNGGIDTYNNPLRPSVGTNNEFGVKALFFDGALGVSATYFDIALTNVRVLFTQGPGDPNPGASGVRQDGEQTSKGFDFSISASKQFDSGTANIVATYYSGETLSENRMKPNGAVSNTTSFLATYGLRQGWLNNLKFGAGYLFKGERTTPGFPGIAGSPVVKLPSYEVVRAFVSYTKGRYSLQLNVDNLLDEDYVQGAESAVWIQTDPGRIFNVTATYRF